MRITIHRGARQIGGSCIEIAAGNTRLILDAGLPLDTDPAASPSSLAPPVTGLFDSASADAASPAVDALFLSHAHADHAGLIAVSRAQVPVWLTAGTSKMLLAGSLFARQTAVPRLRSRELVPGQPVAIGPFRVTAFPVDHSIYDAMAFLVEAEGRRVLYTGDLRFHGRKSGMARQLVRIATTQPLDALLIEGTRLGGRATEANLSEADLATQLAANLTCAPATALAMYSPLNIDRFVTFFHAARAAGRIFVIDPYQAFVLHLIGKQVRLPRLGATPHLRVLVPPHFALSIAGRRLAAKPWAAALRAGAISTDEVREAPEKFLLLFRPSMQPWLFPAGLPRGANAFFSYWPGYLRETRLKTFAANLAAIGGQFLPRHVSGHAHPDDLRHFVEQVRPRLLIPVHTTSPATWADWWPETMLLPDRVPLEIPLNPHHH